MSFDVLTLTPPNGARTRDRIIFPYPSGRTFEDYESTGAYLNINSGELTFRQADEVFSLSYKTDGIHLHWNAGPLVPSGKVWTLRAPLTRDAEVAAGSPVTVSGVTDTVGGWLGKTKQVERLRRAAQRGALPAVMASPPTITLGTSNGAATLPTAYSSVSGTVPSLYFEHQYGNPIRAGSSFPDTLLTRNASVNYGATVGANPTGNIGVIVFETDAPAFEVLKKGLAGSSYRVFVDGALVVQSGSGTDANGLIASPANDGTLYYDLFTFGTRATRQITLVVGSAFRFGGVKVDALSRVWKPAKNPDRVKAIFLGDSYTEGTGVDYPDGSWSFLAASLLGWENWNSGVGSTGYLATGGTKMKFRDRFTADVSAYSPDVIVIAGGINDAFTDAAVQAEASLLFAQALSENPNAFVFVAGSWSGPSNASSTTREAAIQAAAQAQADYGRRLFFLPVMTDPLGAWQFGTGKTTATNGSGNSDFYIGSDGTHPVQAGHTYLARRFADAAKSIIAGL